MAPVLWARSSREPNQLDGAGSRPDSVTASTGADDCGGVGALGAGLSAGDGDPAEVTGGATELTGVSVQLARFGLSGTEHIW